MGLALRNVLVKVGLREPDIDDYEDEEFLEDEAPLGELHEFPGSTESETAPHTHPDAPAEAPIGTIDRIKTAKPTTYSDAKEIGDYLRDNVPVILNLAYLSAKEAQRMVDFASGLTYGLRGSFEEVGTRVFLLSPQNLKTIEASPNHSASLLQTL